MSRRSVRNTSQTRDEDAPEQKVYVSRKRKSEQCKKLLPYVMKQSFEIQDRLSKKSISLSILIETPHKEHDPTSDLSGFKHYRFKNLFVKPSPLPLLSWAGSDDVWINMLNKELKYVHDKYYLSLHPKIQANMRAILLDWIFEVSEVFCLHRQTAYLAQDFFDRFMLTQENVNKDSLQRIGITTLFIASKIEEIYPPKVHEFAYVTDGACDSSDILSSELLILKALNWNLCPETPISWLKLYAQVAAQTEGHNFLVPQFSQYHFIQITQLLDVCTMDINSLDYSYAVLAAAAFCHFTSFEVVHKVSGLTWDNIAPCMQWMMPFMDTICALPKVELKDFPKVQSDNRHDIQTHINYMDILIKAEQTQTNHEESQSPVAIRGILTPPNSTEKPTITESEK